MIVAMPGYHVVQEKEIDVLESTACVSLLGHFSSLEFSVQSVREIIEAANEMISLLVTLVLSDSRGVR